MEVAGSGSYRRYCHGQQTESVPATYSFTPSDSFCSTSPVYFVQSCAQTQRNPGTKMLLSFYQTWIKKSTDSDRALLWKGSARVFLCATPPPPPHCWLFAPKKTCPVRLNSLHVHFRCLSCCLWILDIKKCRQVLINPSYCNNAMVII